MDPISTNRPQGVAFMLSCGVFMSLHVACGTTQHETGRFPANEGGSRHERTL
jgi:hypothetical protein